MKYATITNSYGGTAGHGGGSQLSSFARGKFSHFAPMRVGSVNQFSAFGADPSWLSILGGGVSDQLPTKAQMVQIYAGAIVAFWVVGGLALYLVTKSAKRS